MERKAYSILSYGGLEAAPDRGEFLHVAEPEPERQEPKTKLEDNYLQYWSEDLKQDPTLDPTLSTTVGSVSPETWGKGTNTLPLPYVENAAAGKHRHSDAGKHSSHIDTEKHSSHTMVLPKITTYDTGDSGDEGEPQRPASAALSPDRAALILRGGSTGTRSTTSYGLPSYNSKEGSRRLDRERRRKGTICGVSKATFFLMISNIIFATAATVFGVMFALRMGKPETASTQPATSTIPSSPSSCSGTESPATTTSSIPSNPQIRFQTTTTITDEALNKTMVSNCQNLPTEELTYTVPGTSLVFQRSCENDFTANDMAEFPVRTMEDCIALCAQLNLYPSSFHGKCVGVSWVYGDGPQGSGNSFCYPKSSIQLPGHSRKFAESAHLVQ